jgi:hypothetical protein
MNLWLFDIDGVLIRPGGYRAALKKTVEYFSVLFSLGPHTLTDADIDIFESFGITSEWDSGAICTAAQLLHIWKAGGDLPPGPGIDEDTEFPSAPAPMKTFDFGAVAREVGALNAEGGYPSDTALQIFLDEGRKAWPVNPGLSRLDGWLRLFLEETRNFDRSPTIRVFQAFALGTEAYQETYGIDPPLESESLLAELDVPNIGTSGLGTIRDLTECGKIGASVFTSRPTRPTGLYNSRPDNSPEAEIPLQTLGLDLPLAGYGQMRWLADLHGQRTDAYLKPSPVHAIACIGLAVGIPEQDALEGAWSIAEEDGVPAVFDPLRYEVNPITLFEDTPTGIRSLQQATRILEKSGFQFDLQLIGISGSPEKKRVLEGFGARIFPTLDEGVDFARRQME